MSIVINTVANKSCSNNNYQKPEETGTERIDTLRFKRECKEMRVQYRFLRGGGGGLFTQSLLL